MTTDTEADEIRAWLETHQPTKCPTVALCRTTATLAATKILHEVRIRKGPRPRSLALRSGNMPRGARKAVCGRAMIDIMGDRYGKLVVVQYGGKIKNKHCWTCRCDCGGEITVRSDYLRRGQRSSCGCLGRGKRGTKREV